MTCCVWCLLTTIGESCTFGLKSFPPHASRPQWWVQSLCLLAVSSVRSVAGFILYSLLLAVCSLWSVLYNLAGSVLYSLFLAVSSVWSVAGSVLYSLLLALSCTVCCWLCCVQSVAGCQFPTVCCWICSVQSLAGSVLYSLLLSVSSL